MTHTACNDDGSELEDSRNNTVEEKPSRPTLKEIVVDVLEKQKLDGSFKTHQSDTAIIIESLVEQFGDEAVIMMLMKACINNNKFIKYMLDMEQFRKKSFDKAKEGIIPWMNQCLKSYGLMSTQPWKYASKHPVFITKLILKELDIIMRLSIKGNATLSRIHDRITFEVTKAEVMCSSEHFNQFACLLIYVSDILAHESLKTDEKKQIMRDVTKLVLDDERMAASAKSSYISEDDVKTQNIELMQQVIHVVLIEIDEKPSFTEKDKQEIMASVIQQMCEMNKQTEGIAMSLVLALTSRWLEDKDKNDTVLWLLNLDCLGIDPGKNIVKVVENILAQEKKLGEETLEEEDKIDCVHRIIQTVVRLRDEKMCKKAKNNTIIEILQAISESNLEPLNQQTAMTMVLEWALTEKSLQDKSELLAAMQIPAEVMKVALELIWSNREIELPTKMNALSLVLNHLDVNSQNDTLEAVLAVITTVLKSKVISNKKAVLLDIINVVLESNKLAPTKKVAVVVKTISKVLSSRYLSKECKMATIKEAIAKVMDSDKLATIGNKKVVVLKALREYNQDKKWVQHMIDQIQNEQE